MNIITQHMFSPIRTLIENEIKEGLSEIDNNGNIHEITYIHIKVINGLTRYIIPTDLYFRSPVVTILPFEILRDNFCIPYTEMDSLYGEGYDNDNSDSMYYICLLKGWKDENKDEPLKNNILSNDCSQIHKYNYELLSFTELELCECPKNEYSRSIKDAPWKINRKRIKDAFENEERISKIDDLITINDGTNLFYNYAITHLNDEYFWKHVGRASYLFPTWKVFENQEAFEKKDKSKMKTI